MRFYSIIYLLLAVYSTKIHSIYIVRGQGFIIHINTPKNFGNIKHCRFQFNGNPFITLNLKNPSEKHTLENGEVVVPYSANICGIRVSHLSESTSDKDWSLEVENYLGQKLVETFEITTLPAVKYNFETKVYGAIGDTIKITCSEPAPSKGRFCRIINSDNGEIVDECSTSHIVRNQTRFQCHVLYWGLLIESREIIIVETLGEENRNSPKSKQEEDEETLTLTCKFPNKLFNCRAELPNKENSLFIQNNLNSDRYSAMDTSVLDGKCVLQIKKPITPKERGIWRMFNDHKPNDIPEGCLFYVGDSEEKLIEEDLLNSNKKIDIELLNSTVSKVQINCKMPFSVKSCYIRDPNRNVHFPDFFTEKSISLGYCNFRNLPQIEGEWICGAFRENEKEINKNFNLIIKEPEGEVITKKIVSAQGKNMQLLCQTPFNEPIKNCVFVDPKGKAYVVSNMQTVHQSRGEYYGDGLLQGHCGIQIHELEESDFGTWLCQFNNAKFKINVEKIPHQIIGEASAIGLGIGLGAAVIIIIIASAVIYRRRKIQREMGQQRTETVSMSSRA